MRTIKVKRIRVPKIKKIRGIKTKISIHEKKVKMPKVKMKRVRVSVGLRKPHLRFK